MVIEKKLKKIFGLLIWGWLGVSSADLHRIDGVKAIVNDSILTYSEYHRQLSLYQNQTRKNQLNESDYKLVLDAWINQTLQLQIAKQNGLSVNDSELDEIIRNIAVHNKITQEQMLKEVYFSMGMNEDHYRENIRNQVILSRLVYSNFGSFVKISDQDLEIEMKRRYKDVNFKRYHVIDMVYHDESIEKSKLKALIERNHWYAYISKIEDREDIGANSEFAELWSITDLGLGTLNDFPEIFHKYLVEMDHAGVVSDLIRADNGWHWLKILKIEVESLDKIKEKIRQELFQNEVAKRMDNWVKELREQSYIQVNP